MTTATKFKITAVLAAALLLATTTTVIIHKSLTSTPPAPPTPTSDLPIPEAVNSPPPALTDPRFPDIVDPSERTKRIYDTANARAIAQTSNIWAASHHGDFPNDLAELVLANYVPPMELVSRRTNTPLLNPASLANAKSDPAAFSKEVADHCDFVYLGAGFKSEQADDLVLVYEKPNLNASDGIVVGFHDGHSEFVPYAKLASTFDHTNLMLKAAGKSQVDIPTLLQYPPATQVAPATSASNPLPSTIARNNELANRSADAASTHGICQSCFLWASDYRGHFPDNLAQLLLDEICTPQLLVLKRAGTTPLTVTQESLAKAKSDPDTFAKEVDAHCDFVYLGAGLTTPKVRYDVVLLYEKPNPNALDGINVAFGDSHVEFVRYADLTSTFEHTNALLLAAGKPQVDIPALLKSAPTHP